MTPFRPTVAFPIAILAAAALAAAQPGGGASGQPGPREQTPTQPETTTAPKLEDVPPQVRLGLRSERLRQGAVALDTVVIVSDAASYLEAIKAWRPGVRFPVLIDDGSFAAREDIARFVRGFQPRHVVRWTAPADAKTNGAKSAPGAEGFAAITQEALLHTLTTAWGQENAPGDMAALIAAWKAADIAPPGLAAVKLDDPAWTAGIALAVARGQPLVFVDTRGPVDGYLTIEEADTLAQQFEAAAAATGLTWRGIGDEIDALTLCVNAPIKFQPNDKDMFALTDRLGRLGLGAAAQNRWAWAGQIFGSAPQAAYRAMSSLFLQPRAVWGFDGYPTSEPWNKWDITAAAEPFRQAGMTVTVDDTPRQGARDWRFRAARPVDAGLILVTTKGMAEFFDLEPGQAKPGDVPILTVPPLVHFVHSWSATRPADRTTVAGRWMERGAFAYVGSVHEPFLQAFMPTPMLSARLLSVAPLGVAARLDDGPMWKIAVIGDPLYVVSVQQRKQNTPVPLDGFKEIDATLREDLVAEKYEDALLTLTLLGRDSDAARLAGAVLDQKTTRFTPRVAALAVTAFMRAGDNRRVIESWLHLSDQDKQEPAMRDYLWLAAYPLMSDPTPEMLKLLRDNVRLDQVGRDATAAAAAWAREFDMAQAQAMLREVRAKLTTDAQRADLDKAMKEPPNTWGL